MTCQTTNVKTVKYDAELYHISSALMNARLPDLGDYIREQDSPIHEFITYDENYMVYVLKLRTREYLNHKLAIDGISKVLDIMSQRSEFCVPSEQIAGFLTLVTAIKEFRQPNKVIRNEAIFHLPDLETILEENLYYPEGLSNTLIQPVLELGEIEIHGSGGLTTPEMNSSPDVVTSLATEYYTYQGAVEFMESCAKMAFIGGKYDYYTYRHGILYGHYSDAPVGNRVEITPEIKSGHWYNI